MKQIRYLLVPAVAVLLFSIGSTARADSYSFSFGIHGYSPGYYGHGYHDYPRHYKRRYHYKRN